MMRQVKYNGLIKRTDYDTVLNELLQGKPKIKYPDRTATFIRQSPEYQDLLKSDFIQLEKNQENLLREKQQRLILESKASQISMKSALSEDIRASEAEQQAQANLNEARNRSERIFDSGDLMDSQIQQMEVDSDNKRQQTYQMVSSHLSQVSQQHNYLGGLPQQFDISSPRPSFSEAMGRLEMLAGRVSAPVIDLIGSYTPKQVKRQMEEVQTPKSKAKASPATHDEQMPQVAEKRASSGSRGRSRKPRTSMGDELVVASEPKHQPTSTDVVVGQKPSSSSSSSSSQPAPKPKAKAKARDPETERPPSRARSEPPQPEIDIPIGKSPSQMGIQLLVENFKNAHNKKLIGPNEWSSYLQIYDEWKAAKGNPNDKKAQLKRLQNLWKRVGYKK